MESAPRRSGHDCTDSLSPWFQSSCGSRREQPRAVAGTRSLPPSRAGLVGSLARSLVRTRNDHKCLHRDIFIRSLRSTLPHSAGAALPPRARGRGPAAAASPARDWVRPPSFYSTVLLIPARTAVAAVASKLRLLY